MDISCGGLVGLGFVASVVMLIGLMAATITVKGGRISPLQEEDERRDGSL